MREGGRRREGGSEREGGRGKGEGGRETERERERDVTGENVRTLLCPPRLSSWGLMAAFFAATYSWVPLKKCKLLCTWSLLIPVRVGSSLRLVAGC